MQTAFGQPGIEPRWAHASIALLRSRQDNQVYDRIADVAERYFYNQPDFKPLELWSFNYPLQTIRNNQTLRIIALATFRLHWSSDQWQTVCDTDCCKVGIDLYFADIPVTNQPAAIQFTFFWTTSQNTLAKRVKLWNEKRLLFEQYLQLKLFVYSLAILIFYTHVCINLSYGEFELFVNEFAQPGSPGLI